MKEKKTKKLVLNVTAGCSPFVELTWEGDTVMDNTDIDKIAKYIEDNINHSFHFGNADVKYTHGKLSLTVHPLTDMKAKTETDRKKERKKELEKIFKKCSKIKSPTIEEMLSNNPDKDKSGWWVIDGIRHSCAVKAKNSKNAVEIAFKSGKVGEWEFISADFIGKDPKIISI